MFLVVVLMFFFHFWVVLVCFLKLGKKKTCISRSVFFLLEKDMFRSCYMLFSFFFVVSFLCMRLSCCSHACCLSLFVLSSFLFILLASNIGFCLNFDFNLLL